MIENKIIIEHTEIKLKQNIDITYSSSYINMYGTLYLDLQKMVNDFDPERFRVLLKGLLVIMSIVSAFIVSIKESYVNAIQNSAKIALLIIKRHASVKVMKGKSCSTQFHYMFWLYITKNEKQKKIKTEKEINVKITNTCEQMTIINRG